MHLLKCNFATSHSQASSSFFTVYIVNRTKKSQAAITPISQYTEKMRTDLHSLRFTCGNCSELHSRHWLLLNVVQLIEAFAPVHHLLNWCRYHGADVAISSLAWNPFLWRYYLQYKQISSSHIYKLAAEVDLLNCVVTNNETDVCNSR